VLTSYDEHGKRYPTGLSALYCVNVGHGRAELGEAAARQAKELGFYTNWSYAHPRSIELATRIAGLAPGNLNRVFFTSGGSEAVETAWKLAKAYQAARGEALETQAGLAQARLSRHVDGALTATGLTALRTPFEPLTPGGVHAPTRTHTAGRTTAISCGRRTPSRRRSSSRAPRPWRGDPRAGAERRRLLRPQDGYFQRVREICDRHGILLISDEVICSWGRIGYWFGSEPTATCRT